MACSSCAKEAYTIANKDFPDIVNKIQDEAQQLCGADFVGEHELFVQTSSTTNR